MRAVQELRVWDTEGDEKDAVELKGHTDTIMVRG